MLVIITWSVAAVFRALVFCQSLRCASSSPEKRLFSSSEISNYDWRRSFPGQVAGTPHFANRRKLIGSSDIHMPAGALMRPNEMS
jgi:hypothetical protein